MSLPSRHTTRNRIVAMEADYWIKIWYILNGCKSKIALTADGGSSKVYKGYMTVTPHCIDEQWDVQSAII